MKISAIVAEYNPFHNGHKYHLDKTREITKSDLIIVIMSGNYVQRGEPAIYEKHIRAEMAIKCGADAVIELPLPYSISSAEYFAKGAVDIIKSIPDVQYLSFGSECGDISNLLKINKLFSEKDFKLKLKENMKTGISYSAAIKKTLLLKGMDKEEFYKSNNILALEYLKQLENSSIIPVTIKRTSDFNSMLPAKDFPSAMFLRNEILYSKNVEIYVPSEIYNLFKSPVISYKKYKKLLYFKLKTMESFEFDNILNIKEGLNNKLFSELFDTKNFEEYFEKISSKRYTEKYINRILLNALLNINKADFSYENIIPYINILAVKDKKVLNAIGKSNLTISTGGTTLPSNDKLYKLNKKADLIYSQFYKNTKDCNYIKDYLKFI